jgi:hypothetical protein
VAAKIFDNTLLLLKFSPFLTSNNQIRAKQKSNPEEEEKWFGVKIGVVFWTD